MVRSKNQGNEVKKGYHCAWQIHYHIVFPVKYRRALLDEGVVEIIKETAVGIQERYAIEFEALGSRTLPPPLSMSTRGKTKSFGLYPLPLFGKGRYLSAI